MEHWPVQNILNRYIPKISRYDISLAFVTNIVKRTARYPITAGVYNLLYKHILEKLLPSEDIFFFFRVRAFPFCKAY